MNLLTKIVPFALIMMALAGCMTDKTEAVPEVRGGEAAFRVSVPGMKAPTTRALDAAKEKEITAIDLVIFRNTGNTLIEHHRIGASDISVGTGGNDYQFKVTNIAEPENIIVAVIANASAEVTAALTAVGAAAPKTDFLMALKAVASDQWNTSTDNYRKIPMYGEVSITGSIYDAVEQSVDLTRMLAKVDVVNGVAPAGAPADGDFELTAVHVVNRNRAGLIAPKWDAAGVPEITPATTPNLPTAPDMAAWLTDGDELTYNLFGATSLMGEIYLFESAALSGDNPATSDGLRLVFEGNYTSGGVTKHYYYPVDFTAPDGAYMPVLRNHRYLFTITEAAGRGYDGLGEAVAAFGVMSNLRTSLVVVDESGIRHMVWNGEHFLGVSEKVFTVPAAGASGVALQIATDYADGWRASVENPADTWLTLGASSGSAADKTLTFSAESLTGDEWAFRSGTILLTAGRLETRIPVSQGEYKIAIESSTLLMDGTPQTIQVKANFEWKVEFVSATGDVAGFDNQIVTTFNEQFGGPNTTTGDPATFTCTDYLSNYDSANPTKATIKVKFSRFENDAWVDWGTHDVTCNAAILVDESNCYIVAPNAIPILIPVSRANQSALGTQISGAYSAELFWSDVRGTNNTGYDPIAGDTPVKLIKAVGNDANGYILVLPGSQPGNSVVAAKVGANIVWSWHIWVIDSSIPITTTTEAGATWMDRNLGASNKNLTVTTVNVGAFGLLYQWGRKDPFPGGSSVITITTPTPIYNTTTTAVNVTKSETGGLRNSVENPLLFIYKNWTGSNSVASWNSSGKTVYDPCPKGYKVPIDGLWGQAGDWLEMGTTYGRIYSTTGQYYPAAGYWSNSNGEMTQVGKAGYYWSATPIGANAFGLGFNSTYIGSDYSSNRSDGFSVRCVAE